MICSNKLIIHYANDTVLKNVCATDSVQQPPQSIIVTAMQAPITLVLPMDVCVTRGKGVPANQSSRIQ